MPWRVPFFYFINKCMYLNVYLFAHRTKNVGQKLPVLERSVTPPQPPNPTSESKIGGGHVSPPPPIHPLTESIDFGCFSLFFTFQRSVSDWSNSRPPGLVHSRLGGEGRAHLSVLNIPGPRHPRGTLFTTVVSVHVFS